MSNLTEFIPTFETIKEGEYKFPNEPIKYYPIVARVVPFIYSDKKRIHNLENLIRRCGVIDIFKTMLTNTYLAGEKDNIYLLSEDIERRVVDRFNLISQKLKDHEVLRPYNRNTVSYEMLPYKMIEHTISLFNESENWKVECDKNGWTFTPTKN